MAANYTCIEKRPLKRPRLGPPDVYPQEVKQSEDELTPEKVNKGFTYRTPLTNEYETAKSAKLEEKLEDLATKLTHSYNAILTKKNDLNTLHDIAKKKAGFKEPFWHSAAAKPKTQDVWFRDLAGNKPLATLAKKVPFFNKKDEIFTTLSDLNIPVCRAVWFIKMTNAYYNAQQESGKIKKKQVTDAGNEWMQHLFRFLVELLSKLKDYYTIHNQQTQVTAPVGYDVSTWLKQWNYCTQLGRYMYEESLFDKHEYLTSLLEIFVEKCRSNDDGILKLIIPTIMKHMDGFLQYELHCRNLAYYCCKKLSVYYLDAECSSGSPPALSADAQSQQPAWYSEYVKCPFHRYIMISLSAIVHAILVDCPTALVWNGLEASSPHGSDSGKFPYLYGSPLDHMLCVPSHLPMAEGPDTEKIQTVIRGCEEEIRKRSAAVESYWSFDKCHESGVGSTVSSMLTILETLDKHKSDFSSDSGSIDNLYNRIFQNDNESQEDADRMTVILLCHWAVTVHRFGDHRCLTVVKLLEKRQQEIEENLRNTSGGDSSKRYCFQQALFEYLDTEAPTYSETGSQKNAVEFTNIVVFFGELIKADLFSHDQYISNLISRGDLTANTYQLFQSHYGRGSLELAAVLRAGQESIKADEHEFGGEMKDPEAFKSDMEKLLDRWDKSASDSTGRLEKAPLSVGSSYAPGSVDPQFPPSVESQTGAISGPASIGPPMASTSGIITSALRRNSTPSKHCWNVLYFPVPQDDQFKHERNQRNALMFGFGAAREKQKHVTKKMIKELNKLWHKKNSYECSTGGGLRLKRKIDSASLKALLTKFQELVTYDQYAIIDSCTDVCLDQLGDFVDGKTTYLPSVENVDFLMGLMEIAKNLGGLIEFIEALIMLLPKTESQLQSKGCAWASIYILNHALCCVGFLRKYDSYCSLCVDEVTNIWRGLFHLVSSRPLLSSCPSAERCIWNFLRATYDSCVFLKERYHEQFANAREAFRRCEDLKIEPACANLKYDPNFMAVYFDNPKRKVDDKVYSLLDSNSSCRYSFVVSAVLNVVNSKADAERLFELVQFCADVTSLYPPLASEWTGVFKALCCYSSSGGNVDVGYRDCVTRINLLDFSNHFALSALGLTLVARHCVLMEEFVMHVCVNTLLPLFRQIINGRTIGPEVEPGARLALHMFAVLCLSRDSFALHAGATQSLYSKTVGYSYLVCSAQSSMVPEGLLVLLIFIIVVGESRGDSNLLSESSMDSGIRDALGFGCDVRDRTTGMESSKAALESKNLSSFACEILSAICQQEWTKRKFCYAFHTTDLFTAELLLHPHIKHTQAQKLLHMMTRSNAERELVRDLEQSARSSSNRKELIGKLLRSLTLWNLSTSLLDLQLTLKQAASGGSPNAEVQLVDTIGKATMDVFQGENTNGTISAYSLPLSSPKKAAVNQQQLGALKISDLTTTWLVAPLVERLPANVQGRVLRAAATVLEAGQLARKEKNNLQQGSSLLSQQPFLLLVLTCLRGQDEQREGLLGSLLKQLQEYVARIKEDPLQLCNRTVSSELTEALQLRLSLVGGMFESIFRSPMLESWALLLVQLILHGIVSVENDRRLFYGCLDMLTILLHSCLVVDLAGGSDRSMEEGRKLYANIIRKAKKEIAERRLPLVRCLNQLLPIPRQLHEVIVCEPYGSQPIKTNAKGVVVPATPAPLDASHRRGLQVAGKERVNAWDIIEGYRGDNGLKWSWYQAVRIDHQPETVVQQLQRLLPHDHYHQCDRRPQPGENRIDPYLEQLRVRYDTNLLAAMEAEKGGRKETSEQQQMVPTGMVSSSVMGMVGHMGGPGGPGMMPGQDMMDQLSPRGKTPRKKTPSTRGRKTSRGGLTPIVQYGPALTRPGGAYGMPTQQGPLQQPTSMMAYPSSATPGMISQQQPAPGSSYGNVPPGPWPMGVSQPMPVQTQHPRSSVGMGPFGPRAGAPSGMPTSTGNIVAGAGKQAIAHLISQRTMGGQMMSSVSGAGGGMHGGPSMPQQQQPPQHQHQFANPTNDPTFGQSMQQVHMQMEQQRNQLIQEGMADQMTRPAAPHRPDMTSVGGPGMMGQQQQSQQGHMPQQTVYQQAMPQQQMQQRPPPAYTSHMGMAGAGGRLPNQMSQQMMSQQRPPNFMYQQGGPDYNQPSADSSGQPGFYSQQMSQQQQTSMMQQQQTRMQQERMHSVRYASQMTQNQPYGMQPQPQQQQQQHQRPANFRQMAPYSMHQQQPQQQQQQPVLHQQGMTDQMAYSQQQQQQQQHHHMMQQEQQQQQQQQMFHQMPRQMSQYGGMPPGDPQGGMYY